MLFKTLDAIRQKPKPVRDQYALLFALVCTFVIGGVWSLSLPSRFESAGVASVNSASTTVPFGGMWAEFRSMFKVPAPVPVPTEASSSPSTTPARTEALDLELAQENIDTLNRATTTVVPTPVTILIGTTSTATSTD